MLRMREREERERHRERERDTEKERDGQMDVTSGNWSCNVRDAFDITLRSKGSDSHMVNIVNCYEYSIRYIKM